MGVGGCGKEWRIASLLLSRVVREISWNSLGLIVLWGSISKPVKTPFEMRLRTDSWQLEGFQQGFFPAS